MPPKQQKQVVKGLILKRWLEIVEKLEKGVQYPQIALRGSPHITSYIVIFNSAIFRVFLGVKCSEVFEKCLLKCRKEIGHSLLIVSPRKRRNTCVKC